jgi:hypothetical protein
VLRPTALAVIMAAIASQSSQASDWPRTTRPVSAAKTGLTLPSGASGVLNAIGGSGPDDLWAVGYTQSADPSGARGLR